MEFVAKCPSYNQVKGERKKLGGLLQEIQIPNWMWEYINMDFLLGLPQTQKKYDSLWVVVDRLTKSAHFIPVKSTCSVKDYANTFTNEIVCFHGISLSIISCRGAQCTSLFWMSF